MPSLYKNITRNSVWYPESHPLIREIPLDWRHWLLDKGSLTERLIDFSNNNFRVRVLSQQWARPLPHEAAKLGIPLHLAARIREVELLIHDKAVVFARSIMPLNVYLQQRHTLQNIGSRPLGQLLFRDGKIRVSKRGVSIFTDSRNKVIYGRRTPYRYYGNEILVSEFFIDEGLL